MQQTLEHFIQQADLLKMNTADQIRSLAWYLHDTGKDRVITSDITALYRQLHIRVPNVSHYLTSLSEKKHGHFIRDRKGFRLEAKMRAALAERYSPSDDLIPIKGILSNLIEQISSDEERVYLEETLRCYSVKAFRAAAVMAWNLAYSHLACWLLEPKRLQRFNPAIAQRYPKNHSVITDFDSFASLKEAEVIEICYTAKLVDKNRTEILRDKLKRRNAAAHPSSVLISQAQADDIITDLVQNIIAKL